MFDINLISSSI